MSRDIIPALLSTTAVTLRLDAPLHDAYAAEAMNLNRRIEDHIAAVLLERAQNINLISDPEVTTKLVLRRQLVEAAVAEARKIKTKEGVPQDISLRALRAAAADPIWRQRYEAFIEGDAFAHGIALKAAINPQINHRIRQDLELDPVTDAEGRVKIQKGIEGAVVQSITLLQQRDNAAKGAMDDLQASGRINFEMPSVREDITFEQAQFFISLIRDLEAAWHANPEGCLNKLPEYGRFLSGAYACGFVCRDIRPDEVADEYWAFMREPDRLRSASFDILRRMVHFMLRAERWNDEGESGGCIEQALHNGALAVIADGLCA